jgi:hypothetical protein
LRFKENATKKTIGKTVSVRQIPDTFYTETKHKIFPTDSQVAKSNNGVLIECSVRETILNAVNVMPTVLALQGGLRRRCICRFGRAIATSASCSVTWFVGDVGDLDLPRGWLSWLSFSCVRRCFAEILYEFHYGPVTGINPLSGIT